MRTAYRFWKVAALVLALLMLGAIPTAAQGPDAQTPELYVPFVATSPSIEQGTQEQPLTAAQTEAAAQDVSSAGLLRHEPGHQSLVNDLDVRLAAGEIEDPLGPNTTLVYWDKIAMVLHGSDGKFTRKTYDVDGNLGNPVAKERAGSLNAFLGGHMSIAAGYFGGADGWIDTVAAWEYPEGKISLYVESYNSSLGKSVDATVNTADSVLGRATVSSWFYGALIRVATGDFDGDGYDEFVVAWEGASASLNLRVWDVNPSTFVPTAKGTIAGATLGQGPKPLSVTTGDFNGDGKDEIALAWQGSDGRLVIRVLSVGSTGNLVAEVTLVEAAKPTQVAITAGDFNGDGMDELAVALSQPSGHAFVPSNASLYLYQVTNNLHTLTKKGTATRQAGMGDPFADVVAIQVGLGAGDFNGDAIDELALVTPAPKVMRCNVSVYSADLALVLTEKATQLSSWAYCYGDLSVAVGDMNRDAFAEIAVAARPGAYTDVGLPNRVDVGLFQVAPNLGTIAEKGHISDEIVPKDGSGVNYGHMAMTVGAFDGDSVRVGPPTYRHMDDTLQVLAVINAPPKHKDVLNDVVYDANVSDRCTIPPCTYAAYQTVEKTSTSMAVSTNRDWSVSEEAKLKIPHLQATMKASYGESFEKTTTSFASQEFGQEVKANKDDAVVRLVQSLNIWEYPVYADGSDVVQGHILVVWPDKADEACTSNCSAAITNRIDGTNPTSSYLPNHQVENVLSYSIMAPTDISTTVKSDMRNDLGPNGYHWWVKWADIQTDETKQSNKLNLQASLELSGWGQSLTTSGSYSQGETTVNKVSFETSTEIHLYFYGIEIAYSYGVRPFIYWAKPDGHLVLDYQVTPLTATPDTWWETTYNKPDLTFNLPWANGALGDAYRHLSREITFAPTSVSPGGTVAITAKVRNYSLVGAVNVPVRFYLGDPDQGGTVIGNATVATLNPMSSASATIQFNTTGRTPGETLNIYAVVDPANAIAEVHEENNKAYALLPLEAGATAPGGPKTLFIGAEDIVLSSPAPGAGERVQISATVHAVHALYTWVGVEFWDGNPKAGGQLIGGRLIPLILDGGSATVSVDWPAPGRAGESEVWVSIMHHPDDQDMADNRAFQTVLLTPYRIDLPVTFR